MSKRTVKELQYYLLQSGAELPRWGADGDLGYETKAAIDSLTIPKFLKIGLKEVGIKEYAGEADNPDVIKYHKTTAGRYSDDEVPWCGSFVNWVMLKAGYDITVPYPERATSWEMFGEVIDEPVLGTVAIKSRRGGGHVCIVIGKDLYGNLLCLGGNQNDEVNIKVYPQSAFHAFRQPLNTSKEVALHSFHLKVSDIHSEA